MSDSKMGQDAIREKVNALLRSVDTHIRNKEYEKALQQVREVYTLDKRNAYAHAFEERINEILKAKAASKTASPMGPATPATPSATIPERANELVREQAKRAEQERKSVQLERDLEDRARKAFNTERHEYMKVDYKKIEELTNKRLQELEERLLGHVTQMLDSERTSLKTYSDKSLRSIVDSLMKSPGSIEQLNQSSVEAIDAVRSAYEERLKALERSFEKKLQEQIEVQRNVVEEETIRRLEIEHTQHVREIVEQMERERHSAIKRELERMHQTANEAVSAVLTLLIEMNLSEEYQNAVTKTLASTLALSPEDIEQAVSGVRISKYIDAVRSAWKQGQPDDNEKEVIKGLQRLYHISDSQANAILKRVRLELGYPDENAVILVVDDEEHILDFAKHILKTVYNTVHGAQSVEEAEDLLRKAKIVPALIISDVRMPSPGVGGFTFYERVRDGAYGVEVRAAKFILMSGIGDEFFIKTAKQLGVNAYLTKPFSGDDLTEIVKRVFQKS